MKSPKLRSARERPARWSRWRRALWLLAALALVGVASVWSIADVGHWLVVQDPLEKADAVLALTGDPPIRAMEAAKVFKHGWAPAGQIGASGG